MSDFIDLMIDIWDFLKIRKNSADQWVLDVTDEDMRKPKFALYAGTDYDGDPEVIVGGCFTCPLPEGGETVVAQNIVSYTFSSADGTENGSWHRVGKSLPFAEGLDNGVFAVQRVGRFVFAGGYFRYEYVFNGNPITADGFAVSTDNGVFYPISQVGGQTLSEPPPLLEKQSAPNVSTVDMPIVNTFLYSI